MQAVILAGGKGTRLLPFTKVFPKPLVPLGDKPILDTILRQLKHCGFTRITLAGALYLVIVAILPEFLMIGFKVAPIPFVGEQLDAIMPEWFTQGLNLQFYFGGTSLLIIVGVSMDTVQQVESQLIMRHYDGFMKKTRIRGRRG